MSTTLGSASAPSQLIKNFDALFSLSMADNSKNVVDAIGLANPFFHRMLAAGFYESGAGSHVEFPLMYQLAEMDSYDGYDELASVPIDGVTTGLDQWRQCAVPVMYSMKELKQNKHKIADLVKTKIQQTTMGMQEGWAKHFFQGSGTAALVTPRVSALNGSTSFNPLPLLVHYTPSDSLAIHNINQSTYTWWRNKYKASSATTLTGLLDELDLFKIDVSLGTGGSPDLWIADPTTYHQIAMAYLIRYRQTTSDMNFPFENIKLPFANAVLVYDELIPDVYSGYASYATYGTVYALNTKFLRVKYEEDSDFGMLTDENGKTFAKPLKGDSRLGHYAWMGQTICSNRRKQGVWGKIARTFTTS